MAALSERLRAHLDPDWREDLEPDWREFFGDVEPDLEGLPDWEVPEVAPPRPHMTRAFDGLAPDRVRVVILGQDPYPGPGRATGRAFEDGRWDGDEAPAPSLRRLLQSAAADDRPDLGISEEEGDWDGVRQAMENGALAPPAPPAFFDALAAQGVLSVNAAWTFTGKAPAHLKVHIGVWKPVMQHLLLRLAQREDDPVVFLLLGRRAQSRFRAATWRHFRANPGLHVETVCCAHPAHQGGRSYFVCGNPLTQVNRALIRLEADPIRWWPPLDPAA